MGAAFFHSGEEGKGGREALRNRQVSRISESAWIKQVSQLPSLLSSIQSIEPSIKRETGRSRLLGGISSEQAKRVTLLLLQQVPSSFCCGSAVVADFSIFYLSVIPEWPKTFSIKKRKTEST